ncbi:hypothetical protein RvY_15158 [Ramazzottius varieornatus]|uniref:phosphoethanolamine N-methyltransferase n=1 Tax=Ramazzottius varieornatus TaxID=947166 RepID=A0A1D1VV98_RAMVA|nr:hypothetical protein RvY_15158 [Ramazzottius varieornatus]
MPGFEATHLSARRTTNEPDHVDQQDSVRLPNKVTGKKKADAFQDALLGLGLEGKDVLFIATMDSFPSFEDVIELVRSLEYLKVFPPTASQNGHQNGKEAREESLLRVTSAAESKDVVAINYAANLLDEESLRRLITQCLDALRTGGTLLMREHLGGSTTGGDSGPHLHYRDVAQTCSLLNSVSSSSGNEGLQLMSAWAPEPIDGEEEVTWMYKKVPSSAVEKKLQEFLDTSQYSKKGILKYEQVFGHRYVSTGGEHTTKEFCRLLDLQKGQKVLDVCCGIGGSAFHMAKEYGVHVHGVDLSSNMISIGLQRRREGNLHGVDFEMCNVMTKDFEPNCYDVVYSRDAIMHMEDRRKLFDILLKCLKPGGRLFVTDYCHGAKEHSQEFKDYVRQRGYNLLSVSDYGKLLEEVGFTNVTAEDRTKQFVDILYRELADFEPLKGQFVRDFSQEDYDEIINGWRIKTVRCGAGDQAWGMFLARKT